MPTMVIQPGATVFVTGVNGLIGSYVVDQLLCRGYNVRGAVRSLERTKWLKEYFDDKCQNATAKLELVEVPDMMIEGCYDEFLEDIQGFIHLAAPVGGIFDLSHALSLGQVAALNALKACAKSPSIKRFVNTSSSLAAGFSKTNGEDGQLDENSYNDAAAELAEKETTRVKGFLIYSAMKSETEKAMWKYMKETKPGFVLNCVLPSVNWGPVLSPKHQGYPSTIEWGRAVWTGENLQFYATTTAPRWYISVLDTALLHISALIHGDVNGERLFGYAERWDFNQLLAIFRKNYPEKTFVEDVKELGFDATEPPRERSEEILKWVKGNGWDGLEESMVAMSRIWVNESEENGSKALF